MVIFVLGLVIGILLGMAIVYLTSAHGSYRLVPVEPDEGLYSLDVRVDRPEDLIKKDTIILFFKAPSSPN